MRPISTLNSNMDLRVGEPPEPGSPAEHWMGTVRLDDILGADLITFDKYLDQTSGAGPIEPKAVFVRYDTLDPVTRQTTPVVIQAQLTLELLADIGLLNQMMEGEEEEEEEEEETLEEEIEDRRKMFSSIKGDPILLRAKGAPKPEPYCAPVRYETMCTEAMRSHSLPSSPGERRARHVPPLGQLEGETVGSDPRTAAGATDGSFDPVRGLRSARLTARRPLASPLARAYGNMQSPKAAAQRDGEGRFFSRCVESTATMSSFQKASGRDKFCPVRLRELDRILLRSAGGSGSARWTTEDSSSSPRPPRGRGCRGEGLEAQVAAHIQRIPHVHRSAASLTADSASTVSWGDNASDAGEGSAAGGTAAEDVAESGQPAIRGQHPRKMPAGSASRVSDAAIKSSQAEAAYDGMMAVPPDDEVKQQRRESSARRQRRDSQRRDAAVRPLGRSTPSATVRLRDLDPHLDTSDAVPTQHLHSNWPDGLKRKVARHFYGMTHAQICAEQRRERMRDQRRSETKESTPEDLSETAAAGETGDEREHRLGTRRVSEATVGSRRAREILTSGSPAIMEHGLEIRIRGSDRPSVRVVVSRNTPRVRRKDESAARQTLLLDKLNAERKMLSRKY